MSRLASPSRPLPLARRDRDRQRGGQRTGFTLIELMISIAIVLVLMLGINYVFSTTARTISTGMAVTGVTREIRGARKVFDTDFRNAVAAEEMPAIMIHNEMVYAFKDRQDKLSDPDGDPATFSVDGNDDINMGGTNPAAWGPANLRGVYNHRRHRIDRISFFVRSGGDPYTRQSGDQNTYVGGATSREAWIQYAPLRVADNGGLRYWKPGGRNLTGPLNEQDEKGNHNNYFATQWVLGRRLMLLKPLASLQAGDTGFPGPPTATPGGISFGGVAYRATGSPPSFQPFNRETPAYPTGTQWRVEESRVDLVGSTIADMRTAFAGGGFGAAWWTDKDPTTTGAGTNRDQRAYNTADAIPTVSINYIPWAKAFVNKSNFANSINDQTREVALTTPIFLRGVSQFIVEFAGDFYDQAPPAEVEPLGTIDYYYDAATLSSQIRWYGMPRDTNGDAVINDADTRPLTAAAAPKKKDGSPATPRFDLAKGMPFEKPRSAVTDPYQYAWGPTDPATTAQPVVAPTPGAPSVPGAPYNIRPSLIRVTLELIDPAGKLEQGQRIEFVYRMKTPTVN